MEMIKKLKRSQTNRMLAGVCGGVGNYTGIDPTIIRILFVLAAILGIGAPVIIYVIMAIVMPDEYQI
jgi:phage shock protein PspC (stress-responsive transcriptional regulator)